jgi:hypothetical protein
MLSNCTSGKVSSLTPQRGAYLKYLLKEKSGDFIFWSILWYKIYIEKFSPIYLILTSQIYTLKTLFSEIFPIFFVKFFFTGANLFHLTSSHVVIHLSKAQLSSIQRHLSRSPNLAFFWGTLESTLNRGRGP